jgi:dTDP-4-amino-4,6-dideoxy-D-galactose acyltransferase
MIEKLVWDSEFFGYNVGKIISDTTFNGILTSTSDFKLIYIFSNKPIVEISNKLVDEKLEYIKLIEQNTIELSVSVCELSNISYLRQDMLELVFLSGLHSRFKEDSGFKNSEFEKLYTKWFDKSIENIEKGQSKIFVCVENQQIQGFVTLDFETEDIGRIGLIAIQEESQNKGFASQLIKACEKECMKKNIKFLKVATQGINNSAIKLYEKNEFKLDSKIYIYHHWN